MILFSISIQYFHQTLQAQNPQVFLSSTTPHVRLQLHVSGPCIVDVWSWGLQNDAPSNPNLGGLRSFQSDLRQRIFGSECLDEIQLTFWENVDRNSLTSKKIPSTICWGKTCKTNSQSIVWYYRDGITVLLTVTGRSVGIITQGIVTICACLFEIIFSLNSWKYESFYGIRYWVCL